MQVRDIMKHQVRVCTPETSLASAGRLMGESGCGFLPVVDKDRRILGVITDRDICLAVTTCDQKPSAVQVRNVMTPEVRTVRQGDDLVTALDIMARRELRRLPVVDDRDRLQGLVALNDIVLAAGMVPAGETGESLNGNVALALKAIYSQPPGMMAYG